MRSRRPSGRTEARDSFPSTTSVKQYFVYILSNPSRTLYVGMTSNLPHRVYQHKNKLTPGFTDRYHVTQLVYFEQTNDVHAAIAREKQIKGWKRVRKIA
jgi:putative endonuclease